MKTQTKWNFGIGSLFSLIVVYFIFKYSQQQGWTILAFISKWYLYIFGGLFLLSLAIMVLVMLSSFALILFAYFRMKSMSKARKKNRKYVDVEYEVKE
jgi:predicted membrane protein